MPLAQLVAKRLNEVVRALKRFVAFKDGRPYMCDEPEMNDEHQARFAQAINEADEVKPSVREWILSNWEEVKARERQRAKASRRAADQSVDEIKSRYRSRQIEDEAKREKKKEK